MKRINKITAALSVMVLGCLYACNNSDIDDIESFKDYYYYRMSVLSDYELKWNDDDQHDICTQEWMYFLENCSYLESLTGCSLNYTDSEPPFYKSHGLFMKDTSILNKWFKENGEHWTIRKADAYVYKKRKGHTVYY